MIAPISFFIYPYIFIYMTYNRIYFIFLTIMASKSFIRNFILKTVALVLVIPILFMVVVIIIFLIHQLIVDYIFLLFF